MLDLAEQAGIDGVVCSPHELSLVSKRESLLSITPGIRLKDSKDDQNRVMTPITEAKNIKEALLEIHNSI
jgi:orotidine-5'-phosphate decarboxylase